ncbi:MAG: MDR family MFS transporter [Planctomycetota bacterium]
MQPDSGPQHHPTAPRQRALVTAAMMGGIFLAAMDITAVAPAMPRIVGALGGGELYAWAFSVYAVLSTTTTPVFGRIADRRGRKRTFLAGISIFLLGSAASGAAPSMPAFIGARAVQGIGAAALMTTAFTVVGDLYRLRERAKIQGYLSGVWGIASILGPLVGGTLVAAVGWPWIFYMNIPVGIAAAILVVMHLHEEGYPRQGTSLDFIGGTFFSGAVLLLLVSLKLHGSGFVATLLSALGAALIFIIREKHARQPLFDLALFRIPVYRVANGAGFFAGAVLLSLSAYLPVYVMNARSGSAVLSGLMLTPMSMGWVLAAALGSRVLVRLGYWRVAIPGLAVITTALFGISRIRLETSWALIVPLMFVIGIGFGMSFTTFLVSVQEEVGTEKRGEATSAVQFFRQIGGALGVAILELVFVSRLSDANLLEATPGRVFSALQQAELVAGFQVAFLVATAFAAVALLFGLFAPARGRTAGSGR